MKILDTKFFVAVLAVTVALVAAPASISADGR